MIKNKLVSHKYKQINNNYKITVTLKTKKVKVRERAKVNQLKINL